MRKAFALLLFLLVVSKLSFAGSGSGSHGGDIILCPGKPAETLDWFEARLSSKDEFLDLEGLSRSQVFDLFEERMKPYGNFFEMMKVRAKDFGSENSWIAPENALVITDNANIVYELPSGCSLLRVFSRQMSTVYVSPEAAKLLPEAQMALLLIHEYAYYLSNDFGHSTADTVRAFIREVFKKKMNQTSVKKVIRRLTNTAYVPTNLEVKADKNQNINLKIVSNVRNRCSLEEIGVYNSAGALFRYLLYRSPHSGKLYKYPDYDEFLKTSRGVNYLVKTECRWEDPVDAKLEIYDGEKKLKEFNLIQLEKVDKLIYGVSLSINDSVSLGQMIEDL